MTWFFYQIFIHFFVLSFRLHALFNTKSQRGLEGRRRPKPIPTKTRKRIWVHCASLGEFEQARPVISKLRTEGFEVMLTFFSPSGYEQVSDIDAADWVDYLPFDTRKNATAFVRNLQPDLTIFVKYEFWWNYVNVLIGNSIPILFISVILRENHYLFNSYSDQFLALLKRATGIYLADEKSHQLLEERGFNNLHHSADTRIESVIERSLLSVRNVLIESFVGKEHAIIFGSTYAVEHDEILKISEKLASRFKVLIFPHEIVEDDINTLKKQIGKQARLYSEVKAEPLLTDFSFLIVDEIGLLKDAYQYATLAYIGGGFTGGLHNTLEPFVYKIPLIFGPKYEKFPEARLFARQPFTRVLSEIGDLWTGIQELTERNFADRISEVHDRLFIENGDASREIVEDIKERLWIERE